MKKGGIDINIYNEKNIILLRDYNNEISINYTDKEYRIFIDYLKRKNNEGYIRYYFYSIIEKIKDSHINELYDLVFQWIDKYEFEEYEINQLLSVLCENINIIDKNKLDKIKKFKENKIEISSCDLERLKTYIRIPTESNRVAFVNILEKYIFTYNINVNDFNISQYLLVESSNEFQQNANIFLADYLER